MTELFEMTTPELSPMERAVLELTADLYNGLAAMGDHHPSDMEEHQRDIHSIQNRVMARIARRREPEFFTRVHLLSS